MKNGKRPRKFKLKVSEYDIKPEDREAIINKYKHLSILKRLVKGVNHKEDKNLVDIFKTEMAAVREELKDNYAHKFYLTTIILGPHKQEQYLPYYPTIDDVNNLKETLIQRLSKNRIDAKRVRRIQRSFNGIEYEMVGNNKGNRYNGVGFATLFTDDAMETDRDMDMIQTEPLVKTTKKEEPKKIFLSSLKGGGNVFAEPGTMLKLLTGPGYENRIYKAKKPYDKANYVGVEIELICKVDRETLQKALIAARLAGNVYIKDDMSIQREVDREYTHEITIISKQPNINDVINRVCAVLNSKEIGSYVNDSCGIHVHIDMRNRNYPVCFKNFVNSLPVLVAMVPANRLASKYCLQNISNDYKYSKGNSSLDRRQAINPVSYGSLHTLEIRMHSGSTNATKINHWINILTAIAEHTVDVDKITMPEDMQRIFGVDSKTVEYIVRRINKFKNNKDLNTKDDHIDQSA